MRILNRFKNAYERYLKKLQKANRDAFGRTAPSCCGLNRQKEKPRKQ